MMERKYWALILVLAVLFLGLTTWCYFHYAYHERDESYAYVNGIYIKCHPIDNGTECLLPDGKVLTLKIVKTFVSAIK